MLPKKRRISRKEFPYILAKGKRYNSVHLFLYVAVSDSGKTLEQSRFSFSVSKKVQPLASDRNKYRRRGYSIISKYLKQIKPGYFYFFSFKKSSGSIEFSSLEKEVKELLSVSSMLI